MRFFARIVALGLLAVNAAFAGLDPAGKAFIDRHGADYGLSADQAGELYYQKPVAPGGARLAAQVKPSARRLAGPGKERLLRLLESVGDRAPERVLAPVLEAMLPPGLAAAKPGKPGSFFVRDASGLSLTPAGRNVLMDLLTADAALAQDELKVARAGGSSRSVLDRLKLEGALKSLAAGVADGAKAFDGQAAPQMVYELPAYQGWGSLNKAKEGEIYRDPKSGNVHLIVAAKSAAASDRYRVLDAKEEEAVYRETGVDKAVIESHGGRLVRAIDNLLEVSVPEAEAGALGAALERLGLSAAPSAVMQMTDLAAQAVAKPHPVARAFMPLASTIGRLAGKLKGTRNLRTSGAGDKSAETADLLKAKGLWDRGMTGRGGVIANIDSGVDTAHPDFAGKVLAYIDLVQAGVDSVGHGTHTAGTSAGSGAASGGKYKGLAPDAKLVVIQVFGAGGAGASELAILAAMKISASLPKAIRPDVANMSLGIAGPAGHNLHSTALYAEWLMTQGRLFMAIAAGNSGPKRYTIGAPGNARSVLTVTGVDKSKKFPFFPSRGPVMNWPFKDYNKPDVAAVAGGVDREAPCKYAGGVVAPRSKDEDFPAAGGDLCNAPDNPKYRYMSGTSMATPAAAGVAEDVIAYLKSKGVQYTEAEVKALILETADDLGEPAWVQGAGLINGDRLGEAVEKRLAAGAALGNVPKMLARELDPFEAWFLEKNGRIRRTELGLMDSASGHLVNTAEELRRLEEAAERAWLQLGVVSRSKLKLQYLMGTRNI